MERKTEEISPLFGFKAAALFLIACLISGVVIPYLFYLMHWDFRLGMLLFLPASLAAVLSINHYFIRTEKGMSRGFILTFSAESLVLMGLAYLWLYQGIVF